MGKKKVEDSDSDSDVDDEEKINEDSKSVIIDEGNSSSSSDKSEEESSNNNNFSPVSDSSLKGELSGRESLETISEEENNVGGTVESDGSEEVEMRSNVEAKGSANAEVAKVEVSAEPPSAEDNTEVADVGVNAELASSNGGICGLDEPLNFDNYNSPSELEVHIIVLISYIIIVSFLI